MTDAERITEHAIAHLVLEDTRLASEYGYRHLPLCVLDAVFSINARYESVQNVVRRYAEAVGLHADFHVSGGRALDEGEGEHTIPEMVDFIGHLGEDAFAVNVVCNRQRTSPRSGILKADAAFRLARVLDEYGIHRMSDVPTIRDVSAFERAARALPGQKSGTSLKYLYMLTGADDLVKPDRMILRYLQETLERPLGPDEAQNLIADVCHLLLQAGYKGISARALDNRIWNHQRRAAPSTADDSKPSKSEAVR